MYRVHLTSKFKKDYKRCLKRGLPESEIKEIMTILAGKKRLDPIYKEHYLSGRYKKHLECHIRPDWLLIWQEFEKENEISFVRTGCHAELFD